MEVLNVICRDSDNYVILFTPIESSRGMVA